ncbi:uncharacterized protein MYCGRDRAFT_94946 [Zymoseptoria tritici IPO323]|uniref:RNase MRP protein 1 RNA binding domain-containing protein n=1 Tax=Zymoseptoria tritici (strain CBS 115943 / IPO323) TaxID=336722 RepID=F9XI66_ZYMTI|nr:uncharacterized protein MYCGRDRAFT_94946 [Zymoseptoria tritici IPO323]EGP84885.1 hypothetical protein MYCGRDRAFT_94946 [Zymoseptoria tritici IPO323]
MATSPTLTLNPLHLPPPSQTKLHHLSSLLHLFAHRNKNQHRRSIWWHPFSLFRRELLHLTTSITQYTLLPTTHLARTRKLTTDAALLATTEKRMIFWREILVPKWHFAFSQVVADGRFAVLGVVLMAVLGEVCAVCGITGGYEEMGEREVERVLERFAGEEWGLDGRGGLGGREERMGGEDRGEVVRRGEEEEDEVGERTPAPKAKSVIVGEEAAKESGLKKRAKEESAAGSPAPRADLKRPREKTAKDSSPSLKPSKKKKRKKGGDAIDDLFDF